MELYLNINRQSCQVQKIRMNVWSLNFLILLKRIDHNRVFFHHNCLITMKSGHGWFLITVNFTIDYSLIILIYCWSSSNHRQMNWSKKCKCVTEQTYPFVKKKYFGALIANSEKIKLHELNMGLLVNFSNKMHYC